MKVCGFSKFQSRFIWRAVCMAKRLCVFVFQVGILYWHLQVALLLKRPLDSSPAQSPTHPVQ